MKNPFSIIWAALKSIFSKSNFSWINMVNFLNIIVTVITAQAAIGTIPMGLSILIVSVITLILKLAQSHKTLVETGVNADPVLYLVTLIGVAFGAFETFMSGGYISEWLSPQAAMWVNIIYSVVLMYLRTGYTNQSEVKTTEE